MTIDSEAWERALREDKVIKKVLADARPIRSQPKSIPASIRAGRELIADNDRQLQYIFRRVASSLR